MPVRIEIEGTFASREEAAEAIHEAALDIGLEFYSATVRTADNPSVSVVEVEEEEEDDTNP